MILKNRHVVPVLLLSPNSDRNVVPELLLLRQLRDDVAVVDRSSAAIIRAG